MISQEDFNKNLKKYYNAIDFVISRKPEAKLVDNIVQTSTCFQCEFSDIEDRFTSLEMQDLNAVLHGATFYIHERVQECGSKYSLVLKVYF